METENPLSNNNKFNNLKIISTPKSIEELKICDKIIINIKNKDIIFNKIDVCGTTSLYFTDDKKQYFLKIPILYLEYDVLKREIHILKILKKYNDHFPKIVYYDELRIITEYIGEPITKNNIPNNIIQQINEILNIFKKENIIHSDIKKEELLIKNDNLYLVDFGWAKINDCWGCDIGLCNNEKPFLDKTIDKYKIFDILLEILNE